MKPTILLLHGAIGAKDQLEPLKEMLSANYKVYTMSFVGHGERDAVSAPFSMQLFAEDVIQFLDKNGIESISIFGYSMGGYVAMYLAKYYASRVKNIIILGSKFYWNEEIASKEIKMLNAEKIEEKIPNFAKVLATRHVGSDWKTVLDKTKTLLIALGENNTLKLEDYTTINHHVLVLLGDNDSMVTKEESEAVVNKLPNGRFSILLSSDHPIEKVDLNHLVNKISQSEKI